MATAAVTFHQVWYIGRRVEEDAIPHRQGFITVISGSGPNARITVALDGLPPVTFQPGQLTPL